MASQSSNVFAAQDFSAQDIANTTAFGGNTSTEVGGKRRVISDRYTLTSAVTANASADSAQAIRLCKVPKGAKIISIETLIDATMGSTAATVRTEAINSDGTLTGTAVTTYNAALNMTTVARTQNVTTAATMDVITATEVAVVIRPTATNTTTATSIGYIVEYVVE